MNTEDPLEGRVFLRRAEVARMLGVSTWTIREWIKRGRLPGTRVGRCSLIPVEAVRALVERATTRAA